MRVEAAFDCLTITSLVQENASRPSKGDIHLLAYLASLLRAYSRRTGPFDWGYEFAATPSGAPFSQVLEVEMNALLAGGAISSTEATLELTASGTRLQEALADLNVVSGRIEYLDSASATTLAIPVGLVRVAFAHQRENNIAATQGRVRSLVSKSALAQLFLDFNAVAQVLDAASGSLLAASVLWLSYLLEQEATSDTE